MQLFLLSSYIFVLVDDDVATESFCDPPSLKRLYAMTVRRVSSDRLIDSAFWFLLYRPLIFSNCTIPGGTGPFSSSLSLFSLFFLFSSDGPHVLSQLGNTSRTPAEQLYEVLLPSLTSRPLLTHSLYVDPSLRWRDKPIGGDRTGIHTLRECLYICLSRLTSPQIARYVLFLLLWEQAKCLREDLEMSNHVPRLELKMIEIALRRFASIAIEEVTQDDTLVTPEMVEGFF